MAVERRKDDPEAKWNKEYHRKANRRDTSKFCRGKPGVEHDYQVVLHHAFIGACRWYPMGKWYFVSGIRKWMVKDYRYSCIHFYRCTQCGKYGNPIPQEDCPEYTPKPSLEDA